LAIPIYRTLCNEDTAGCVLLEEERIRTVRFAMKTQQGVCDLVRARYLLCKPPQVNTCVANPYFTFK
jgi:hypothetical protein